MANQDKDAKTLEMRIAAIEDKLAKMNVTEEEMRAYEKVSAMMGAPPNCAAPGGGAAEFTPNPEPSICQPILRYRGWPIPRIVRQNCWAECGPITRGTVCDCSGPLGGGGGMPGGGGFGNFGF